MTSVVTPEFHAIHFDFLQENQPIVENDEEEWLKLDGN